MNITISVVIPAHNEENYIAACLDALIENAFDGITDILVIDNLSTDNTSNIANTRPGVRIVREEHKGITSARQRGLIEANGNLIAYIDADTRVPNGWIEFIKKTFYSYPHITCLSGPYRYFDGPRPRRWLLNVICWAVPAIGYRVFGHMVIGGNFVARKDALKKVGGFNMKIDFYGEDTDIGRRLTGLGIMLYSNSFYIYSSARRFYAEGFIRTNARYLINFIWVALFGKPFSHTHKDVRVLVDQSGACHSG